MSRAHSLGCMSLASPTAPPLTNGLLALLAKNVGSSSRAPMCTELAPLPRASILCALVSTVTRNGPSAQAPSASNCSRSLGVAARCVAADLSRAAVHGLPCPGRLSFALIDPALSCSTNRPSTDPPPPRRPPASGAAAPSVAPPRSARSSHVLHVELRRNSAAPSVGPASSVSNEQPRVTSTDQRHSAPRAVRPGSCPEASRSNQVVPMEATWILSSSSSRAVQRGRLTFASPGWPPARRARLPGAPASAPASSLIDAAGASCNDARAELAPGGGNLGVVTSVRPAPASRRLASRTALRERLERALRDAPQHPVGRNFMTQLPPTSTATGTATRCRYDPPPLGCPPRR